MDVAIHLSSLPLYLFHPVSIKFKSFPFPYLYIFLGYLVICGSDQVAVWQRCCLFAPVLFVTLICPRRYVARELYVSWHLYFFTFFLAFLFSFSLSSVVFTQSCSLFVFLPFLFALPCFFFVLFLRHSAYAPIPLYFLLSCVYHLLYIFNCLA